VLYGNSEQSEIYEKNERKYIPFQHQGDSIIEQNLYSIKTYNVVKELIWNSVDEESLKLEGEEQTVNLKLLG